MKNNRTFLEKLLDGTEVEWKTIAEISNKVSSGGTPTTSNNNYYENGNIPWLRTQEVDFKEIWNTDLKITEEGLNNSSAKWIPKNCVIVAMYGATVGKIAINKIPLTTNQACANIEVNPEIAHYRYVFHYLMSKYEYIKSLGSGSQTNINSQIVKKIRIPIPPLSVQTEIVKILDALTALTSELTSELILRRKQYEYYREKLLSEEELIKLGATAENLGDVTSISSGGTPSTKEPAYWVGGNIPWIKSESCKNKLIDEIKHHITEVGLQNSNAKLLSPNTTLMAMVGATIFKTAFLPFEATTNQNIAAIKSKNELSITDKFIFYYLTNMYDFFISKLSGYNMVNLSQIKNIKILLPPLEEQQRIVSILDKFEALTNSITEGLPLAIEQSQKRYEYYRELLLNFS